MMVLNQFIMSLDKGLAKYPSEKRSIIRQRILDNVRNSDIFKPLHLFHCDPNEEEIVEIPIAIVREERVKEKQIEFKIKPESKPILKYGRTLLHEAVATSNIDLIKKLLSEGHSTKDLDNNGNTPIDHALLDENDEVLAIFKANGHI
jgi:ankyrin repeat protein